MKFGDGLDGIVDGRGKRGRIIITHGAGKGMDSPILEKTARELAALEFTVLRFNFAYLGKKPAPSKDGKVERNEIIAAIQYLKGDTPLIIVGKSFGARISSYIAAERDDIQGLVFYGLPLQGIGKNSRPRDWSHMAKIKAKMLFVTGDKDALCPLDQLKDVQATIKSAYKAEIVAGDHSFKPKGEDKAIQLCLDWIKESF